MDLDLLYLAPFRGRVALVAPFWPNSPWFSSPSEPSSASVQDPQPDLVPGSARELDFRSLLSDPNLHVWVS